MAKQQTKFTADDGKEFDSEADALAYERITQAQLVVERASEKLNHALAESLKTGDGRPFQYGHSYYVILTHLWAEDITRVYFAAHDCSINQDYAPRIIRTWYDKGYQSEEYALTNVFVSERKAKEQLLALRRERLQSVQESIDELEKQLAEVGE